MASVRDGPWFRSLPFVFPTYVQILGTNENYIVPRKLYKKYIKSYYFSLVRTQFLLKLTSSRYKITIKLSFLFIFSLRRRSQWNNARKHDLSWRYITVYYTIGLAEILIYRLVCTLCSTLRFVFIYKYGMCTFCACNGKDICGIVCIV